MAYWCNGQRYVEPFAGSAALFFAIKPDKAVLSDINEELIETLTEIRDHPKKLFGALVKLPLGKRAYYRLRALESAALSSTERAARFIFLNRFCFNGLYRTNLSGRFNVPYSPRKTGGLPSLKELTASAILLKRAVLKAGDFETVCSKEVRKGDFVYLDPPYAVGNRRIFRQYGPNTFGLGDIHRLRTILFEIDSRGATFVLSYAYCREALVAFAPWASQKVYTQRNISGFATHRKKAAELIVSNASIGI